MDSTIVENKIASCFRPYPAPTYSQEIEESNNLYSVLYSMCRECVDFAMAMASASCNTRLDPDINEDCKCKSSKILDRYYPRIMLKLNSNEVLDTTILKTNIYCDDRTERN